MVCTVEDNERANIKVQCSRNNNVVKKVIRHFLFLFLLRMGLMTNYKSMAKMRGTCLFCLLLQAYNLSSKFCQQVFMLKYSK